MTALVAVSLMLWSAPLLSHLSLRNPQTLALLCWVRGRPAGGGCKPSTHAFVCKAAKQPGGNESPAKTGFHFRTCVSHDCACDTVSPPWGQPRRGEDFPLSLATKMGLFGPQRAIFGRLEVPLSVSTAVGAPGHGRCGIALVRSCWDVKSHPKRKREGVLVCADAAPRSISQGPQFSAAAHHH